MADHSFSLGQVLGYLREIAPDHLAEDWDAVGLQLGFEQQPIRRALLCIDLTEPVLDEALDHKCDLVVAYHPPIFKPLAALTDQSVKQRIILRAARAGLAIYSPHTALDAAANGVNQWLAQGLGSGKIQPIKPTQINQANDGQYKLVTFVPHDAADQVRKALSDHGAGNIGQYSECSFGVSGQGTFRGSDASNPTVGRAGRFEREPELRMELVIDRRSLPEAVSALWQVHPYEQPPYDVYQLVDPATPSADSHSTGQGRVLVLDQPVKLRTVVNRLKKRLGLSKLFVGGGEENQPVQRIGVCVGSGASVLDEAGDLEAMITGEMSHHRQLAAAAQHAAVVLAGHTQTERPYLPTYRQLIVDYEHLATIDWRISQADAPPTVLA